MPSFKYTFTLAFLISFFALFFLAIPTKAAITITSATLNGSSNVTVSPSASINAQVNITTTTGSKWAGTSWTVNGSTTCVDTPDTTGNGSYSANFTITAPAGTGNYGIANQEWLL